MKIDMDNSLEEFKKGLFGGKVNRFVSKITVSMSQEEVSQFVRLMKLNNQDESLFFEYDAFVPGGENLGLGKVLTKWIIKALSKNGTYEDTFYSQTASDRQSVQEAYISQWKNVKASLESADTLADNTKKSIEL